MTAPGGSSLANLRRLVPTRLDQETCDLCSEPIPEPHRHLYEPAKRALVCACQACSLLFSSREAATYRLVPQTVRFLPDFQIDDALWAELSLPVNMAFLHYSTPAQRVVAYYPSPAGATESLLALDSWQELVDQNPALAGLVPDVEALLVNRIGLEASEAEYFIAPIDECYRLVGIVRAGWRGLSGGTEVWKEIKAFFEGLKSRAA